MHRSLLMIVLLALAACRTSAPPVVPAPTATPAPPGEEATVAPAGDPSGLRPPDLTLDTGTGHQQGELGTHCWSSRTVSACADMIGVLAPLEAVEAPSEGPWALALAGEATASGTLRTYVWVDPIEEHAERGWAAFQPDNANFVERVDLPLDRHWSVEPAVPLGPGKYLVWVQLAWPGAEPNTITGDAAYGFHLVVK